VSSVDGVRGAGRIDRVDWAGTWAILQR